MPTARSIDLVELPVASAEAVRASSAFFATVFGWSFATYGDEYADTADSRVTFGLNGSNPEGKSSAPLAVLYVDDLEAARDAVIASGGAVTRPIYAFPGGRRFHFVEPSGNELAAWSDRETTTGQGEKTVSAEYAGSDQFRGARIHLCDLAGLEIRDCDVTGLKIVDSYGSDVYLGGDFTRLVVNDVDVTAYVEAELDQRHPARVLARDANTPDDYRAAWDAIEIQWAATLDRARLLPEATLHERVNGEWSFVETQRHLLMASDAWLGNAVLEEEAPYDPLGLPHGGMPRDAAAQMGLSLEATPTLDEVLAPRGARMATMRRVVDGLTDAELDRVCGRKPADPYPDQDYVVRRCLKVVLKEEAEHHRYAVRDLAVLEARAPSEGPEL